MRKLLSLAPLLLLLMTTPAHANLWGKGLVGCPTVTGTNGQPVIEKSDTIVNFGQPGQADHWHTFMGNKAAALDASRMTSSLMAAAGTTCFWEGDESGIWVPAWQGTDGTLYPASMSYYVAANGANPAGIANGRIQMYPPGWAAIFHKGDPGVSVLYRCGNSPSQVSSVPFTSTSCTAGWFSVETSTPNICWDGEHLDSANHRDHFRNNLADGSCPIDFGFRLPQQQAAFTFSAAGIDGRPNSDHDLTQPRGYSWHYDYKALWRANEGEQFVRCLNDPARNFSTAPLCGVFTFDGVPNANPWEMALRQWATTIGYVFANGNPNGPPPAGTP